MLSFGRRKTVQIGEIIEVLISEKDNYTFQDYRREAMEEACNLLSRLPRMEEACTYEPVKN